MIPQPQLTFSPCVWRILLLVVLVAIRVPVNALNPDYPLSKYIHTSWGSDSGLMTVRQIAQTPDGYLWLATSGGLVRFDGVRFTTYTRASEQSLDNCSVLVVDSDGSLWVGTFGGVIAHLESGRFHSYSTRDGLPSDYIQALYRDPQGALWVGMREAGIFRMTRDRFEKMSLGIPPGMISGILEDSDRSLWIATWGNGVFRLQNGGLRAFSVRDGLPDNRIARFYRDRSGKIWAVGLKGISSWNGTKFVGDPVVNAVMDYATRCTEDRDGNLWIGSVTLGLLRMRAGHLTRIDASSGLSADNVQDVFEDKEGNIWVGTDTGLDRLRDTPLRTFTVRDGLFRKTTNFQWPIVADHSAEVWTAAGNRIAQIAAGQITYWSLPLPTDSRIYTMLPTRTSGLLVGSSRGLDQWSPGHVESVPEMTGLDIRSLLHARDGSLWLGTANQGLLHWKSYPKPQSNVEVVLPDKFIISLAEGHDGAIWAGSHGGGLYRIAEDQVQHFGQKEGLPSSDIFSVFVDGQGALWIGSARGLSWFQSGRICTANAEQGLRSDLVFAILDDSYDRLWFLGHVGVGFIEKKSLSDWAAGRLRSLNPTFYRNADGLPLWTMERRFPNAAQSTDGHLWFAFAAGLAEVIPPNPAVSHNRAFPVLVEDVTIDNVSVFEPVRIRIPPGARSIQIRYTALTLTSPESVRFRYMLERFDDDWIDADVRRIAYYNNLNPGTYIFRVEASAGKEHWLESSPLLVEQAPFFYQTKWFLFLVAATALLLVFLMYRLRLRLAINRIQAGFQQRMDERTRIARELHDTLLQSIQGAAFQLQAARKLLLRSAENGMEVLDEAIATTEEAITEGRSAIHDLRPEPVAQRTFPELVNGAGRELAGTHELNGHAPSFRVIVEGKQQTLSPILQDEVYRITCEAIRNAFKHSGASRIEVEIHYDHDQLRLRIRDDGKGIDPQTLEASGKSGHFGIPGIRERAQRIGSRLDFWSEAGAGTEVELTVPAVMAYRKQRNGRRFRLFRRANREKERS